VGGCVGKTKGAKVGAGKEREKVLMVDLRVREVLQRGGGGGSERENASFGREKREGASPNNKEKTRIKT